MAPALALTLSLGHTADAQRYPGALRLRQAGKGTHTAAGWRRRSALWWLVRPAKPAMLPTQLCHPCPTLITHTPPRRL